MKRRELASAVAVGALAASGGCLSQARDATTCSPSSRFGLLIENHRPSPQSIPVEVETGPLGRNVFSKTFDVPAASDPQGQTYHPEVVYASGVLGNLRSYTISVRHDGETATYSWRVTCDHLYVRINQEGHASPAFRTLSPDSWARITEGH